jgi:hypothetical protein
MSVNTAIAARQPLVTCNPKICLSLFDGYTPPVIAVADVLRRN